MKTRYWSKALLLFELFRSRNITEADLEMADKKSNNLTSRKADFQILLSMCKDTISGKYKMDTWALSVIIATILYVISPLDAIPDMIPVLGWIDDVTIIGYAITKLSQEIEKYKHFNEINFDE